MCNLHLTCHHSLTCKWVISLSMFSGEVTQLSGIYLKFSGNGSLSTALTQVIGTASYPREMSLTDRKGKQKQNKETKKNLQVFSFPFWGMADFEKAEIHQPTKEQDKVQHYLLSTLSPRPSLPLLASVSFLLVLRAVHTLEPEAQQSRAVSPSLFLWLTSAPRDRNNLRVENV